MATSGAVTHTLQADFSGTAFGGSPTWTDITAYLMSSPNDPGGQPVAMPWGRQDQSSTVEPASTVLVLKNSDGRFTPGNTSSPYYPHVKRRVRIRYTITSGTTLTLFDGYVDSWTVTVQTDGPTLATVSLSDTFARLSASTALRAMVVEEMLLDAPTALYPLSEAEGATSAGDISGNSNLPLVVTNSKYGAGTLTFGADTGLALSSTGAAFSSPDYDANSLAQRGTYLAGPASMMPTVAGWSIELWFLAPNSVPVRNVVLAMGQAGGSPGYAVNVEILGSSGSLAVAINGVNATGFTGVKNVCDGGWHHVVLTHGADDKTDNLYVDGQLDRTVTEGSVNGWTGVTGVTFGFAVFAGIYNSSYDGTLANVATYATALSATRVLAHYNAGKTAFAGESTATRFARLAGYRPNLGVTTTGTVGVVGSGATAGMSLGDAFTDTATAEGGVLQTNRGVTTLIGRSNWYDPATTLTLNAATGQVDLPTTWRDDTQALLNDATVSRPDGASQRSVNSASVTADGVAQTSITANVNSDRDAADMAGWLVAVGVQEHLDCPTLTVNLYVRNSASLTMAVCALKTFDIVTLTNLPASAPASTMSFQVQGSTITVGSDVFTAELYTTVMPPLTLRADATADAYTKLDNGLVFAW
jgi:hypothetical protein